MLRCDADGGWGADVGQRFAVEARLLARLRHPGLVELFDHGHVPQGSYLALELIRGPTLRSLIAAGPLAFAETLRIGQAVAGTVSYVHAAGVVHRDVKPSNILLDGAARPRLSDFGVSSLWTTARPPPPGPLWVRPPTWPPSRFWARERTRRQTSSRSAWCSSSASPVGANIRDPRPSRPWPACTACRPFLKGCRAASRGSWSR